MKSATFFSIRKSSFHTPVLSPLELEVLLLGQHLLDLVVGPLDQHRVESDALEQVGHSRGVTEGVDGPTVAERRANARLKQNSGSKQLCN